LTERRFNSYERFLNKWIEYEGDNAITEIETADIRKYLAWLRTEYVPQRYNGKTHQLSSKTIRIIWVTLALFIKWACMELDFQNPIVRPQTSMDGVDRNMHMGKELEGQVLRYCFEFF
jgi:hypothetical protein